MTTFINSQAQQIANMAGPLIHCYVPGDATSGHGYNAGNVKVYTGSAPATANAAETGTLLINWVLPATAFGTPSAALPSIATANAITNVNASATGTAGYGRLLANGDDGLSSTAEYRGQFDVGTSGASMTFNTVSIVSGAACSITAMTLQGT